MTTLDDGVDRRLGTGQHIGEIACGIGLSVLGVFVLIKGYSLELWDYGGPGPGFFPFLLAAMLTPLGVVYLGASVRRFLRRPATVTTPLAEDEQVRWGKVIGYIVGLGALAPLMSVLGWKVALGLVLFVLFSCFERISLIWSLVHTGWLILSSYLLFEVVLSVPLPKSTLW
jgi:putative tricarboxylic transport membrane protein